MFSGIIEQIGEVREIYPKEKGKDFLIYSNLPSHEIKLGDSICLDGCCLTVTEINDKVLRFFASHETLSCTTLGQYCKGTKINLERSLQMNARLDGHFVQGHVESKGILKAKEKKGDSIEITIQLSKKLKSLVIPKGSIAVDGISLTINWIKDGQDHSLVGINLIPYTLDHTALCQKEIGQEVNLETDILGRYVKRMIHG